MISNQDKEGIQMPIYKRCSRCGKRIEAGTTCPCVKARHKEYDRYSRDSRSKQYYHSKEWDRVREDVLTLDGGIDVYLYMTQGTVVKADTVHHIVPLREDWNKRNERENLISLHHDTHSMIEQMYKQDKKKIQTELQEMIQTYRKE